MPLNFAGKTNSRGEMRDDLVRLRMSVRATSAKVVEAVGQEARCIHNRALDEGDYRRLVHPRGPRSAAVWHPGPDSSRQALDKSVA